MTVTTYDPSAVYLTIGEEIVVGWNTIAISRDSFPILTIKGIRGKHTRTLSYDTSATVRISLPSGSEWNAILSSLVTADIANGTSRCELMLKDTGGGSLFKSAEAFVTNYADVVFDDSLSERLWIIQCLTTSDYNVGHTTTPAGSLLDSISSGISNLF